MGPSPALEGLAAPLRAFHRGARVASEVSFIRLYLWTIREEFS